MLALRSSRYPPLLASLLRPPRAYGTAAATTTRARRDQPYRPDPKKTLSFTGDGSGKKFVVGRDPVRIAASVRDELDHGRRTEALDIVHHASRYAETTVAWNHLIEEQMKAKNFDGAFKLYNDVCPLSPVCQCPRAAGSCVCR